MRFVSFTIQEQQTAHYVAQAHTMTSQVRPTVYCVRRGCTNPRQDKLAATFAEQELTKVPRVMPTSPMAFFKDNKLITKRTKTSEDERYQFSEEMTYLNAGNCSGVK